MNPAQSNELCQRLKGLIPKIIDQQMLACAGKLDEVPFAVGEATVQRYAEENDEFVLPRFIFTLRLRLDSQGPIERKLPPYRYVDVLRKDLLRKGRAAADWSDTEVVVRVARGWYLAGGGKGDADGAGACPGTRRADIARTVARTLMQECCIDEKSAGDWAHLCFEDEEHFETCVSELRGELALA